MRVRLVALLTALMALFVATPALAVPWGEPDTTNEYPHVGTLLFQQGNSYYSCTGTLLSSTVMLTAGHCTFGEGAVNAATWVSFEPVIDFSDWNRDTTSLEDYLNTSPKWIAATAYPHPEYDDFAEWPNTYDVGVVVLSEEVELSEYGELPELNLLEDLTTGKNHRDRQFTVVGYGLQGYIKPLYSDIWGRYSGNVRLIEINSTQTGDGHSAKFTANPGKGNGVGGSCYGDSGGPVFYGDTNIIGAVVSWGRTPCIGNSYEFRVDTALAQDFINTFLAD